MSIFISKFVSLGYFHFGVPSHKKVVKMELWLNTMGYLLPFTPVMLFALCGITCMIDLSAKLLHIKQAINILYILRMACAMYVSNIYIYVMEVGDTGWIGRLIQVAIYPAYANLLRKVMVLATPIQICGI